MEWDGEQSRVCVARRQNTRLTDNRDFAARVPKPSVASFSEIPRGGRLRRRGHARIFQKACRKPAMPSRASCRGSSPENLGLNVNCFTRAMNAGNYAACG
jgi:hypothetical protein